jgi:hypothetical protein
MLSLALMLLSMNAAQATDPLKAGVRVPSIEEVVVKEGFTPTPSQSDIYRPGAVLVQNDRGGHDMVVENCVSVEPTISLMSQSSIATSLSAGVTARLAVARGDVATDVERRLSFVDPEQRTLPLGRLTPTDACVREVRSAGRIRPLTDAFIVQDVLVAQIKNTVCTKADASGRVTILGEAEAAAYSECIQESDGQVPIGYKSVPWTSLSETLSPVAAAPINSGVTFDVPDLGVDAMLKQQACQAAAEETAVIQRQAQMSALVADAETKAADAWAKISPQAKECVSLQSVQQRAPCIQAVEKWLDKASSMQVTLPAGIERVPASKECGPIGLAFPALTWRVEVRDISEARNVQNYLKRGYEPQVPTLPTHTQSRNSAALNRPLGILLLTTGAIIGSTGWLIYDSATEELEALQMEGSEACYTRTWGHGPCGSGSVQNERIGGLTLSIVGGVTLTTGIVFAW